MSYIAIVDYGAGNLMSVHNSLDFLGYENKIAASPEVIEQAAGRDPARAWARSRMRWTRCTPPA